ncbi:hypothetical protein J8L13_15420 [Bacteroides fragilis]|uniref:hypothetical protein n=1 Tax=Bacteroides fragilis TaxID=817 RepID=UPI002030E5DF|nr:hypothetical protein [Bacteroides fragilis]MCM0238779.1 hypothetical protein [Bacteroides fragilis]
MLETEIMIIFATGDTISILFITNHIKKGEQDMAMPIKETPILFGEDARKFEERMKHPRKETPEERKIRLEVYEKIMKRSKL